MTEPEPGQQAEGVTPAPLPLTVAWRVVAGPNVPPMVELTFATPAGVGVYFLPPPMAHGLAEGIEAAASDAEGQPGGASNIIVPGVDMGAVLKSLGNGVEGGH